MGPTIVNKNVTLWFAHESEKSYQLHLDVYLFLMFSYDDEKQELVFDI